MDKGKGKATDASGPLTSRKSTRGKATPAKTIPGTSRKTPASKAAKPARKSRAPMNATTREMNIHIPTVKARRTGTLLYKRTGTRRQRPGARALADILFYRKSLAPMIPSAPFNRLVRDIATDNMQDVRFQKAALVALQEASEAHLINELSMANLCAIHAKRVTIQQKDMQLVQSLRSMIIGS